MTNIPPSGKDDLSCYFGLSYASWLTLPRVLMEAMPDKWQKEMAKLLNKYDNEIKNPPDLGTRVQVTKDNKLVKTPEWLINYRHPDRDKVNSLFGKKTMTIFEQVRQIIVDQLGVDEKMVTPEASLIEDLGADSLDIVDLVIDIEQKFGFETPDEDAEKIITVQDAVDVVERLKK